MERLWIEFGSEALDVLSGHSRLAALEAHAELKVVEPFDHAIPDVGA
jgi:hypothetical protein